MRQMVGDELPTSFLISKWKVTCFTAIACSLKAMLSNPELFLTGKTNLPSTSKLPRHATLSEKGCCVRERFGLQPRIAFAHSIG